MTIQNQIIYIYIYMEIYENNRKLSDFGKPSPAVIPSNPAFLGTKNWHHEDESVCYMYVDSGPAQND